jgi:hypothetical protein
MKVTTIIALALATIVAANPVQLEKRKCLKADPVSKTKM